MTYFTLLLLLLLFETLSIMTNINNFRLNTFHDMYHCITIKLKAKALLDLCYCVVMNFHCFVLHNTNKHMKQTGSVECPITQTPMFAHYNTLFRPSNINIYQL